jgi:hypothetical protein
LSRKQSSYSCTLATAGSACKEISDATVTVLHLSNSGDVIEWYDSQESSTILKTGSIFSPVISKTTFYVQSRSGSDLGVRVPVVASVFNAPSNVSLTVSPSNSPICKGVPLLTAAGGDLFEFSIDNIVVQPMSTSRVYTTTTLSQGQVVRLKQDLELLLTETFLKPRGEQVHLKIII